jgi:hypothetical protein
MKQKQSLLLFSCERSAVQEDNHFKYQSNGLIMDLRAPGGCVMYPLNHNVKMRASDWPQDSISVDIPDTNIKLVSVFMHNAQLQFAGMRGFDCEEVKDVERLAVNYKLLNLRFDRYFHVLGVHNKERLMLIAVRSKLSHDLEPLNVVEEEAAKAGLALIK